METATSNDGEIQIDRKLGDIYDEALKLYNEFDNISGPMNAIEVQIDIKKCIKMFEDATKLVSLSGYFSSNETYEEVATENLKYFLLPFYLGRMTTRICSGERKNLVEVAEVYFKDFLKRCEEYELIENGNETRVNKYESQSESSVLADLTKMARQRNSKIEQYKMKKELDAQIKQIRELIERDSVDDDVKRDFYTKILKSCMMEAQDEIDSISQEKLILEHMSRRAEEMEGGSSGGKPMKRPSPAPLKPIIITKDAAQKAVFGLGYPSYPTMTVSEFYDDRVREGIFPDPTKALQNIQAGHMLSAEKDEEERIQKEQAEEDDDPEYLARTRAMDEFRDNVRRGDGNRHNRS